MVSARCKVSHGDAVERSLCHVRWPQSLGFRWRSRGSCKITLSCIYDYMDYMDYGVDVLVNCKIQNLSNVNIWITTVNIIIVSILLETYPTWISEHLGHFFCCKKLMVWSWWKSNGKSLTGLPAQGAMALARGPIPCIRGRCWGLLTLVVSKLVAGSSLPKFPGKWRKFQVKFFSRFGQNGYLLTT